MVLVCTLDCINFVFVCATIFTTKKGNTAMAIKDLVRTVQLLDRAVKMEEVALLAGALHLEGFADDRNVWKLLTRAVGRCSHRHFTDGGVVGIADEDMRCLLQAHVLPTFVPWAAARYFAHASASDETFGIAYAVRRFCEAVGAFKRRHLLDNAVSQEWLVVSICALCGALETWSKVPGVSDNVRSEMLRALLNFVHPRDIELGTSITALMPLPRSMIKEWCLTSALSYDTQDVYILASLVATPDHKPYWESDNHVRKIIARVASISVGYMEEGLLVAIQKCVEGFLLCAYSRAFADVLIPLVGAILKKYTYGRDGTSKNQLVEGTLLLAREADGSGVRIAALRKHVAKPAQMLAAEIPTAAELCALLNPA